MHAQQERPQRLRVAEEVIENRPVRPEGLLPAVAALAHRVRQIGPHREKDLIGVEDISSQSPRARPAQVRRRAIRVGVGAIRHLYQKTQADVRVEQPLQRVRIRGKVRRQFGESLRPGFQAIEYAQAYSGEHGLGAAEGVDKIDYGRRIGSCHLF